MGVDHMCTHRLPVLMLSSIHKASDAGGELIAAQVHCGDCNGRWLAIWRSERNPIIASCAYPPIPIAGQAFDLPESVILGEPVEFGTRLPALPEFKGCGPGASRLAGFWTRVRHRIGRSRWTRHIR